MISSQTLSIYLRSHFEDKIVPKASGSFRIRFNVIRADNSALLGFALGMQAFSPRFCFVFWSNGMIFPRKQSQIIDFLWPAMTVLRVVRFDRGTTR